MITNLWIKIKNPDINVIFHKKFKNIFNKILQILISRDFLYNF
jgi:hypothetical protein